MSLNFFFLNDHIERLLQGSHYLFPLCKWLDKRDELNSFLFNEFVPSHYFRLSIVEDTLYFAKKPHTPKGFEVKLANAQTIKSGSLLPAYLKVPNYLIAEMELREVFKRGFDDVIFFDSQGFVTEASTSNIFVLKDNQSVLTPKASSTVLAGVMRNNVMSFLKQDGWKVDEAQLTKKDLESACEIWLTNSVSGIRQVQKYESTLFSRANTKYEIICQKFGRFGEKFNHE